MNITISIIIILVFIYLWWLIGKSPNAFIKTLPYLKRHLAKGKSHVFSAETSSGNEAEFIKEDLIEKNNAIKILRIFLSLVLLIFTLFFILHH